MSMSRCRACNGVGLLLPDVVCPLCDGVPGWPEKNLPSNYELNRLAWIAREETSKRLGMNGCVYSSASDGPSVYELNRLAWTDVGSLCRGLPYREIRAVHDLETVRVYQAYNKCIASQAAAANSFRAPLESGNWSKTRMTWIKPSAVWMAYRCGWTVMKDKNQGAVLALDLSRRGFEQLLMQAELSHGEEREKGSLKERPVVVQWDPERLMSPNATEPRHALTSDIQCMRSIQIGLRGSAVEMLLDPAIVVRITDVTAAFVEAHLHLSASPPNVDAACVALWPNRQEERLPVPFELRTKLMMDIESSFAPPKKL